MATNENTITTVTTEGFSNTRQRRSLVSRIVQNFILVWLDGNIDEIHNEDCRTEKPDQQKKYDYVGIYVLMMTSLAK